MKIFILNNLIFLTPLLLILLGVNWFGDAASLFSKSGVEYKIAKYLSEGYHVENVYNIDERKLQQYVIRLFDVAPEAIIIGSSRAMLVGSAYANNTNLFNHGVSGCSIEDMIAIFQIYRSKGKLPKKIVVGVDPWLFNKNNGQDRWKSLETEFYSFFENGPPAAITGWAKYSQLFSPAYFQSSIKMLLNRKSTIPSPIKDRGAFGDTFIRLTDGTIHYDKKYRSVSVDEVEDRIRSFTGGEIYSLENYDAFAKIDVQRFDVFIKHIISENIEVEFLMMPYPQRVYEYLISNHKYQIVEKFEQYIRDQALKYHIVVTGSLNPAHFDLGNQHFYDGMHLNEKGVAQVLKGKKF